MMMLCTRLALYVYTTKITPKFYLSKISLASTAYMLPHLSHRNKDNYVKYWLFSCCRYMAFTYVALH